MSNNRGYANDATDTARCFLMHNEEVKPFVQGKTAEEIKEYYFANEKAIKGGAIYDSTSINWEEVQKYCMFGGKDLFDNFDDLMHVVEMEDLHGLPKIKWINPKAEISTCTFKGMVVTRKFVTQWNGYTYWIYVKDNKGNILDGVEKTTSNKDSIDFTESAQFLLLKALYHGN